MRVHEQLLDAARPEGRVRRVAIGCFFAQVSSESGTGIASVMRPPRALHRDLPLRRPGELQDMDLRALAGLLESHKLVEASVGLAALNSVFNVPRAGYLEENAAELVAGHAEGRGVVVVGGFPFVQTLRRTARWLEVFELEPLPGSSERPADEVFDYLGAADVVVLSATTLMNHTFEELSRACRKDSFVVMVGPSTPLTPLLFEWGVSALAGSVVEDEAALFRTLSQGATFRQLRGVRKVVLLDRRAA